MLELRHIVEHTAGATENRLGWGKASIAGIKSILMWSQDETKGETCWRRGVFLHLSCCILPITSNSSSDFFFFSGSGSRLHATYLLLQTNFLGPSSYRWCRFLSVPMFNQSALHPELVLSGALWTPLIVHLGVDWKSLLRASAVACSYHLPQFLVFNTSNSARQQLGLILILLPVCGLSNIEKKL